MCCKCVVKVVVRCDKLCCVLLLFVTKLVGVLNLNEIRDPIYLMLSSCLSCLLNENVVFVQSKCVIYIYTITNYNIKSNNKQ